MLLLWMHSCEVYPSVMLCSIYEMCVTSPLNFIQQSTGVEHCHKEVTVTEEPVSDTAEPSSLLEVEVTELATMSGCALPPVTSPAYGAVLIVSYIYNH
jgi:hypothetical protein